jgi:hypothetical protein
MNMQCAQKRFLSQMAKPAIRVTLPGLTIILMMLILSFRSDAKEPDTTLRTKKNVISYNITAPLISGWDNVVFGYERIVKKNQSFSIMCGYRNFPGLINPDSSLLVDNHTKLGGFSISADYRFYLLKRNKIGIPDGVYIGPYFNYYTSSFGNDITFIENNTIVNQYEITTDIATLGIGFELGYQFVFWNKLTLDLILFGPGYAWYGGKMDIKGEISIDEESELYQKLIEMAIENADYVKIIDQEFEASSSGRVSKLGLGFRYVVRLGWHF